jgi:hypothetical protein
MTLGAGGYKKYRDIAKLRSERSKMSHPLEVTDEDKAAIHEATGRAVAVVLQEGYDGMNSPDLVFRTQEDAHNYNKAVRKFEPTASARIAAMERGTDYWPRTPGGFYYVSAYSWSTDPAAPPVEYLNYTKEVIKGYVNEGRLQEIVLNLKINERPTPKIERAIDDALLQTPEAAVSNPTDHVRHAPPGTTGHSSRNR